MPSVAKAEVLKVLWNSSKARFAPTRRFRRWNLPVSSWDRTPRKSPSLPQFELKNNLSPNCHKFGVMARTF
jgi:hypothetical protein